MSVEEYRRTSFEPEAELVDGRVEERSAGAIGHGRWQDAIQAWFRANARWGLRALPAVRVQITAKNFRVPDVSVLPVYKLGGRVVTEPPVAVFEVLSPEDRYADLMRKLREYEAMGIRNVFVVDPANDSFLLYQEGGLRPAASAEVLAGLDEGADAIVDWGEIRELY